MSVRLLSRFISDTVERISTEYLHELLLGANSILDLFKKTHILDDDGTET
jgi:hypothetical protein